MGNTTRAASGGGKRWFALEIEEPNGDRLVQMTIELDKLFGGFGLNSKLDFDLDVPHTSIGIQNKKMNVTSVDSKSHRS